jgi:hypothetical protein
VNWAGFAEAAPDLAADAHRLIFPTGTGDVMLATVRGDEPPRIHPISVEIVEGHLLAFILAGPKLRDLTTDGRYAMHNLVDQAAPSEVSLRGRATVVTDLAVRAAAVAVWSFEADDSSTLFDFSIEHAVLGVRAADEWPPRYTSWGGTLG